eukprot:Selendium_serpulae@DN1560_c0_g1_i3.p1
MKKVPDWLLELGSDEKKAEALKNIEKNLDLSSGHDTAVAYAAGCDCETFPDGLACPWQETAHVSVKCEPYKVWRDDLKGAELADVVTAIDSATANGADVAVMPVWFDMLSDPDLPRQAPRVLRGAMQRATDTGVLFAVPAGDNAIDYGDPRFRSIAHNLPCGDTAGMDSLCVSSVNPLTGWPSSFANVPRANTIYAVGEQIETLGLNLQPQLSTGTSMALSQGVATANMLQGLHRGISGSRVLSPSRQIGFLVNPSRPVAGAQFLANDVYGYNQPLYRRSLQEEPQTVVPAVPGSVLDAGYSVENVMFEGGQYSEEVMKGACYLNNVNFVEDLEIRGSWIALVSAEALLTTDFNTFFFLLFVMYSTVSCSALKIIMRKRKNRHD